MAILIASPYEFAIPLLACFNDSSGENKAIIMGRNTYFSLPVKKLPNRKNIVITSHPELIEETDIECFYKLNDALEYFEKNKLITYVIGGSKLYEEALNDHRLKSIYLNIIKKTSTLYVKLGTNFNSISCDFGP